MKAIFKNKYTVITLIVVIALVMSAYAGLLDFSNTNDLNTICVNENHWGIHGVDELIGPRSRSGFIRSFLGTGYSETISLIGKVEFNRGAHSILDKYK